MELCVAYAFKGFNLVGNITPVLQYNICVLYTIDHEMALAAFQFKCMCSTLAPSTCYQS